jgi:hypothetical protein
MAAKTMTSEAASSVEEAMIRRCQYHFAWAVVSIGVCLSLAIMITKPAKEAPMLKDVRAIKSDRISTAFRGLPTSDNLGSKPIRVIPISMAASLNQPTKPPVLTRIATPMATSPVPEEPSHAVSTPETAISGLTPAEAVDPPRHRRHYSDACAAHGMRKVETNHGRSWHCAGLARR